MDPLILSNNGKGVRLTVTSTSSRARIVGKGDSLVLSNPYQVPIYVAIGGSTIEADLTCFQIPPGEQQDGIVLDPKIHADFYNDPWIAAVIEEAGQTVYLGVQRAHR